MSAASDTNEETLKVIGIDTKSTGMHWVSNFRIGTHDETYGWTNCKTKHENPRRQADLRRMAIFDYSFGLATALPAGTKVYCEEPLALQNGHTTRLLGLAAGAVWSGFHHGGRGRIEWVWVDVSNWKKTVFGRATPPRDFPLTPESTRTKRWIQECVHADPFFQMEVDPVMEEDFLKQLDLYDAWAIRRFGVIRES